jgi:hypothetical protein
MEAAVQMKEQGGEYVGAADLRIGDVVEVWWKPRRDVITGIKPYTGPLMCLGEGAKIIEFANCPGGMTLAGDDGMTVLARGGR